MCARLTLNYQAALRRSAQLDDPDGDLSGRQAELHPC